MQNEQAQNRLKFPCPLGLLTLAEARGFIVAIHWSQTETYEQDTERCGGPTALLTEAKAQLTAYFRRRLKTFDLPLADAGTPYQQRVFAALRTIPYGETRSYAQIAAQAGGSPRSVGQANAANRIPIIIPCHRVVASAGLGGYSGAGGLGAKRWLLELETKSCQPFSA